MTGPALRVVANGLESARSARGVLLVLPDKNSPQDWDLYDWPKRAHALIFELLNSDSTSSDRAKVSLEWRGEGPRSGTLRDPLAKNNIPINKINNFWHRALDQNTNAADDLLKAWTDRDSPVTRRTLLPLPGTEAGLLLPLERARTGLTMLAPEGSPLHGRTPMRPSADSLSAVGRPWLGQPDSLVKLASLDQSIASVGSPEVLLGPPDVGRWLRDLENGLSAADHPYSVYLDANAITRTALGRHKEDLLWLFDRMHVLHYASLNGVERIADPGQAQDDKDSPAADRRLQQLLSSPGLMRLFGFARDVYVDFDADLPAKGFGIFVEVKTEGEDHALLSRKTAFELNRGLGLFYPATRTAYNNGNDPLLQNGIRRLSNKRDGHFCYSMVSIETVVSADEDMQCQANQRNGRVTTGPLALVCCDPDSISLDPKNDGEIDFAEELSAPPPDRLDIGIDTDDGSVHWYSASPRVVSYRDPHPAPKDDMEWPQRVIESLTPNWLPPFERDAGGLVFSTFRQMNNPPGRQSVDCFDPRMAAYGGEAVGAHSKTINSKGNTPLWETTPVVLLRDQDLIVSQQIEVPKHGPPLALRRFGWRYHFGIRRSFLGGAGPTLRVATAIYDAKNSDAPFPPVTQEGGGFRYLRHDPIAKPIVMLAPDVPLRSKGQRVELQTSAQMVLVSRRIPRGGHRVDYTARFLVVPSVDPQMAALHEVFDELGDRGAVHDEIFVLMQRQQEAKQQNKSPPKQIRLPLAIHAPLQGLKNVRLHYDDPPPAIDLTGQHRFQFGAGERRASPYYPDPAACYMVLRLQHPERPNTWLSPPLVVRVRGDNAANEKQFAWPNLLPVRIELYAADERRGRGLELSGGEIVQERGQLFRRVTVSLLPGESAILKAWAAPDAEDLLAWFDVVERSAQLCSSEGEACKSSPGLACATGRQSLLGGESGPLQDNEQDRRQIAGLYHQRILETPVFLFADVADIHLVHATDVPWHAARFVHTPKVARPSSLDKDLLADFLLTAGPAAEWGPAKADDKATAVIAGGVIEFDQATASGLVVEAAMVHPGSGVLDPGPPATPAQFVPNASKPIKVSSQGEPDFGPLVWTEVLRIQGIPLPADGRAGPRRYALEQLMLGTVAEMEKAKIQYGAPLNTGQARTVRFRIIPLPRYAPMLSRKAEDRPSVFSSDMKHLYPETSSVWIPSTIRPAAPDVKGLIPTFTSADTNVSTGLTAARITSSTTRLTGLRLVLRRPWFGTGEGERAGIVFWPPSVLDLASPHASHEIEIPSRDALMLLTEEDVGPVGRFVSVFGLDPIEPIETDPSNPGGPINRPRFLSPEDFVLPPGAIRHPRVLMPLPGATLGKNDEHFVAVSIVSFPLTFVNGIVEPYVDLELTPISGVPDPVIRLGVVRMQLNARLDAALVALASDPLNQEAIRCSPPVSVQSQLFPTRRLSVTATELGAKHGADGDQTSVAIALSGPAAPLVAGSSDTRVIIELLEHISGNEVPVRTISGDGARREGDAKGGDLHYEYEAGEATWTTSFLLPGKLGSRQIIARAHEDVVMESANPPSAYGRMPRYFGQIAIKPPVISN